jgi:hypothetical protein
MDSSDWTFLLVMLIGMIVVMILPDRNYSNGYKNKLGKKRNQKKKS